MQATGRPGRDLDAAAARRRRSASTAPRAARARTSSPAAGRGGRAGRRPGPPARSARRGSPTRGNASEQRARVGVQRVGEDLLGGAALDDPAGVHHQHPVADVGEHRQVVADDQQADAELAHQVARAGRGSGPAPSRRGRSSARRRRSAAAGRPAPSRSSPAASGRRRAGAGRSGRARGPARPARAARRPAPRPAASDRSGSCTRIGSAIWRPTRCTGFSECSAPWKTIEAPAQRSARRSPHFIVSTSPPSTSHLAGHLGVLAAAAAARC